MKLKYAVVGILLIVALRALDSPFLKAALTKGTATASQARLASGQPAPEVSETQRYYAFGGATVAAMLAELDRLGPGTPEGRFHAYTSWYVRWRYDYDERPGSCGLGPVKTTVTVGMQLPRWSRPSGAPYGLAEKWDAYVIALRTHENGHRDIGVEAARAVAARLATLPRQPTCAQLEALADSTGQGVLEEARVREREYDRRTRHGASQGALFR